MTGKKMEWKEKLKEFSHVICLWCNCLRKEAWAELCKIGQRVHVIRGTLTSYVGIKTHKANFDRVYTLYVTLPTSYVRLGVTEAIRGRDPMLYMGQGRHTWGATQATSRFLSKSIQSKLLGLNPIH
ncbi:hypothetical protein PIB30_009575 [Stylosanthes scabra]|uniref:Uncharacterized protein n=1 Tax=Stylosanthes scabra TaxID=79078 RepID=A0ABU6Q6A2_9FABA|nr:hypothetical protein [Stylosanthes scabra]